MAVLSLCGKDSLIFDNQTINGLADGDSATLTMGGDISARAVGFNKNMVIAPDLNGYVATLEMRVLKGCDDDKALYAKFKTYEQDPPAYVCSTASLTKRLGDGAGNVTNDTYNLTALHFTAAPTTATINVNGDTDQVVTVYTLAGLCDRAIG